MKWMKDAKEDISVADGNGEGNDLSQLAFPSAGVLVDRIGLIIVFSDGVKEKRKEPL